MKAKGCGNALMGRIAAARDKFVIRGDADDGYDFLEVPRFVDYAETSAAEAHPVAIGEIRSS